GFVRGSRTIERCSSKVTRQIEMRSLGAHEPFDEPRSIIDYLRAKRPRSRNEHPTNCGRSHLHSYHRIDPRACAWIGVDAKMYRYAGKKILPARRRRIRFSKRNSIARLRPSI